jgi:hypothetical protein
LLSEDEVGPVVLKLGRVSGQFQLEIVGPANDEPAA